MRAFFIVFMFVLIIAIFLNGSLGGIDLTPNTSSTAGLPSVQAAGSQTAFPQVIMIQGNSLPTVQAASQIPVTGECSNPYTVQPGDTLLQIAINCNTTLAAIRQANPQISDANLIYPGQQINIPSASTAAEPTVMIPMTGNPTALPATVTVTLQPLPTQTASPFQVIPTVVVPASGAYPTIPAGNRIVVKGIDFPPYTPVDIAIGPLNQGYTVVLNGITDANGSITTHIILPQSQNVQTLYVVVLATDATPPVQAQSKPFYISPFGS